MKTLIPAAIRCSLMFTAVTALSIVYPASVQAVPITYQYTGNPFTFVTDPPYTTSDFVTAMVTLAGPLGKNRPLTLVTPTAFTLSDGVQTITNLTSTSFLFRFATGPTGAITVWGIVVAIGQGDGRAQIFTINEPVFVADAGTTVLGTFLGLNRRDPGTWSVSGGVADAGSQQATIRSGALVAGYRLQDRPSLVRSLADRRYILRDLRTGERHTLPLNIRVPRCLQMSQ
jgi:hypothetical protein